MQLLRQPHCSCTMCCCVPVLGLPWWPVWIACDRAELVRLYHIEDGLGFCLVSQGGMGDCVALRFS